MKELESGFRSFWRKSDVMMQGLGIFFPAVSRPAQKPTQTPIQRVPGAPSPGVKRPEHEDDYSPLSSAEVKNEWSYIFSPPIRLHGVMLSW